MGSQYMDAFVDQLMQPGDNSEKLATLAEAMADWCHTTAVENRRRRLSDENTLAEDFIKWIDDMEVRRLEGEDKTAELPAHMYDQCAGYAYALKELVATGQEDPALIFGASSMGRRSKVTTAVRRSLLRLIGNS